VEIGSTSVASLAAVSKFSGMVRTGQFSRIDKCSFHLMNMAFWSDSILSFMSLIAAEILGPDGNHIL